MHLYKYIYIYIHICNQHDKHDKHTDDDDDDDDDDGYDDDTNNNNNNNMCSGSRLYEWGGAIPSQVYFAGQSEATFTMWSWFRNQ